MVVDEVLRDVDVGPREQAPAREEERLDREGAAVDLDHPSSFMSAQVSPSGTPIGVQYALLAGEVARIAPRGTSAAMLLKNVWSERENSKGRTASAATPNPLPARRSP